MHSLNQLRAWVRYDKEGRLIPGTLVLRKNKPSGKFKEMTNPYQTECCAPTTTTTSTSTSTTTTTTTAVLEFKVLGEGQYGSASVAPLIPGTCSNVCGGSTYPTPITLYSPTSFGTQPTIGMQLYKDAGFTLQFPAVLGQPGDSTVLACAPGNNFNGGGGDYPLYAYRVQWGNKVFAVYMCATSWIGPANSSPVTNYAVVDFRECVDGNCV